MAGSTAMSNKKTIRLYKPESNNDMNMLIVQRYFIKGKVNAVSCLVVFMSNKSEPICLTFLYRFRSYKEVLWPKNYVFL